MASHFVNLEPFLSCPGSPPTPWEQWKNTASACVRRKEFHLNRVPPRGNAGQQPADQDNAAAAAPPPYSDEEKNLDIFLSLGTEGQRQFNGTPDSDNFVRSHVNFMKVLDGLFQAPVNRLIALNNFRHRLQGRDELATAFCAELRTIAKQCKFSSAEIENSEIADTLIVNCYDQEVKQKLFSLAMSKDQKLTIDDVLNLMRAEETSKSDVKTLQSGSKISGAAALSNNNRQRHRRANDKPVGTNNKSNNSQSGKQGSDKVCDGCGRPGHAYLSPSCPAKNSTCRSCGKLNHWDVVCRKKAKGCGSLLTQSSRSMGSSATDSRIQCDLLLQPTTGSSRKRHKVRFLADTGAEASTLHASVYKSLFRHVPLSPTNERLQSFNNKSDSVTPQGLISLRATFRSQRSAELPFFVVPDDCLQLLGISEMASLKMMVDTVKRSVFAVSQSSAPSPAALLESLEKEFPILFSPGIGKVPNFQHRIQLKPGAVPKRCKMRYPPVAMEEDASKALDNFLEEDIIEQIEKAEYVHPLHFIRKPDKDVRVTVDLSRGVNQDIVPSMHPLPRPQEIFSRIGNDEIFSKLDVPQAFLTIELAPESRPLTAFITPSHGLCQFKRMPMGMTDSGATFQRRIEQTLSGLQGVHAYCDDIVVHAKTREEHDARLRAACKRLEDDGFRLKKSKLVIAQREIPLLGHIISSSPSGTTIKPDPKNGEAISRIRVPTNVSDVRSFLGFCNYHSSFIKNYAEISEPLLQLTRKNARFEWTESCQQSFEVLKAKISSPEVLVPFNPNFPSILTTDASDVGLGAVLSQLQEGKERTVAFAAKTLSSSERNYSTPEREALGCVWASEHFEKFLLGRSFTLRTDQDSLRTLMARFGDNRTSKRISRWYDRLRHFEYTVHHIKGKDNVSADLLSRLAAELKPSSESTLADDNDDLIIASISSQPGVPLEEVSLASKDDPDLQLVRDWLRTSFPPRKQIPQNLKSYFDVRDELSVKNHLVFRGENLVIPSALEQRVLDLLHSGHPGIVRMKQKYSGMYFWPGGTKSIESFVRNCHACSASGKNAKTEPVPVTAVTPPSCPWQKVALDITGPLWNAPRHQRFIVVVSDYFSKFPEILLTNSITSTRIISWLKEVFSRFGNPEELVSDNGPQFVSSEFEEFLSSKNIIHNRAAVYNPAQNGLVEVFNRSIKNQAQIISVQGTSFSDGMLQLLSSFRSTPPENGLSPSTLMFGWNLRSDSDIRNFTAFSNGGVEDSKTPSILPMEERQKSVKDKFEKRRYGRNPHRGPRSPYRVGQWVTTKTTSAEVRKGCCPRSSPLRITKVAGRWTYELENGKIWNARKLRRFRDHLVQMDEEEELAVHGPVGPTPPRQAPDVFVTPPVVPRRSTRATAGVPPSKFSPSPIKRR